MDSPAAGTDDHNLLQAIGANQDRAAFNTLYLRYQARAFHLAYYLTSNRALAEEAVQDGMLHVWRSAPAFRSEGNAKGWILRIIARASLNTLRRRKSSRQVGSSNETPEPVAPSTPDQHAEKDELALGVRTCFNRLSPRFRQILSLYFMGELSQREIGELLGLAQTSVSDQIEHALKSMRRDLKRAGFTAAVPLLAPDRMSLILSSGLSIPTSMKSLTFQKLKAPVSPKGRYGRWVAAGGLVAAIAGALYWVAASPQPHGNSPLAAHTPLKKTSRKTRDHWDFNTPEWPAEWTVTKGEQVHSAKAGPDGSGCVLLKNPIMTLLRLNTPVQKLPILISYKYAAFNSAQALASNPLLAHRDQAASGALWSTYKSFAIFHNIAPIQSYPSGTWHSKQCYVTREGIDYHLNGQRVSFTAMRPQEGATLLLFFRLQHKLDELSITHIDPKDVPDTSTYLNALARIPIPERVGEVTVPWLPSRRPPHPVTVTFSFTDAPK